MSPIIKSFQILFWLLLILFLLLLAAIIFCLYGSFPIDSGKHLMQGLQNSVRIERDSQGIPSIFASNRLDIARSLGFIQAQDRFFQMDLLRRAAAGELSELLGRSSLESDKKRRMHQFRNIARKTFAMLNDSEKQFLIAYAEGVNEGLKSLTVVPFEYLLLLITPQPWLPEDSLLVGFELFFGLQDSTGKDDLTRGIMQQQLPKAVYDFLLQNGSEWEAPLDQSHLPKIPIPSAEDFAYLRENGSYRKTHLDSIATPIGGSNHWVVSGKHTLNGKPLLACDMHLPLSIPNIWYRTSLSYLDTNGKEVNIWGITLPGLPLMMIGSNSYVSWGFTNACIDTTDLVMIEVDPHRSDHYLTAEGSKPFNKQTEIIKIKGEKPETFTFQTTIWGPVIQERYRDHPLALLWVAHDPQSFNLSLQQMETAQNLTSALSVIKKSKVPLVNVVLADRQGNIAWTLIGRFPKRLGFDGSVPISFADGTKSWKGEILNFPLIVNPSSGLLWTANNRVVGQHWLAIFGRSFSNSIRAWQIRHRLQTLRQATPEKMLEIQLDDEAFFFKRWQLLLLEILKKYPEKEKIYHIIKTWDGKSSCDSKAYRLIRQFRASIYRRVLERIFQPCIDVWKDFSYDAFDYEEPVWMIVHQRPFYLIDPKLGSWDAEFLAILDEIFLSDETWGEINPLKMQHPLSQFFPFLRFFLDMQQDPMSGDFYMPHVQSPTEGASQRMVVSPGNEREAIFHVPGGQSGHPLSPHYRDGHSAWLKGDSTPFLPGSPVKTLILNP